MTAEIIQGNVFDLLPTLKHGSADCVVTSPPYWQLRSYLPKDHPLKPMELGSEKSPEEFVANLVRVFGLVRTALAPHGTVWLNIGDSYSSGHGERGNVNGTSPGHADDWKGLPKGNPGIPPGNLCLIPQRLALALQKDGWVVRSVVAWAKPAPMPASVAGWRWVRCRVKLKSKVVSQARHGQFSNHSGNKILDAAQWKDCEGCPKCEKSGGYVLRKGSWRPTSSWEPILMLAKSERYFADGEACKTPALTLPHSPGYVNGQDYAVGPMDRGGHSQREEPDRVWRSSGGANLRDVWRIADPIMRLRSDLTAEQRREVLSRLLAAGL